MHRNYKGVLRKGGAIALVAGSIAAIGLAAPGFAHPHPDGDGDAKKIEKIVILESKKDGKPGDVRHFRIHRDGKPGERREMRIEHDGKPGEHVREFHIKRDGKPGEHGEHVRAFRMLHDGKTIECPEGDRTEVDEETGADGKKEKTRIVVCHDDKLTGAERAAKLEKTLERLRSDDKLSGEHRARVEAAIQSAIEKLRASN